MGGAQSHPRRSQARVPSRSISTPAYGADFATGDEGGDAISLYAYLNGLKQGEAAQQLAGRARGRR